MWEWCKWISESIYVPCLGILRILSALHIIRSSSTLAEAFELPWELPGKGTGTPLQYSCLENPMDGGAWWAAVHGVAKSRTRLSDFTFTFHFHALEKEMATHSSVLAWRIPGTEKTGRLQSMGLHRVGHDWANSLSLFPFMHWRRKWQPTPVFLPGGSQGRGSLVGCHLCGRTESDTTEVT